MRRTRITSGMAMQVAISNTTTRTLREETVPIRIDITITTTNTKTKTPRAILADTKTRVGDIKRMKTKRINTIDKTKIINMEAKLKMASGMLTSVRRSLIWGE